MEKSTEDYALLNIGHQVKCRRYMSHEYLGLGEETWKLHFSLDICRLWAQGPKFGCQRNIAMNQYSAHPFGKTNSSLRSVLPTSTLASGSGAASSCPACVLQLGRCSPDLPPAPCWLVARQGRRTRMFCLLSTAASPLNRAGSLRSIQPPVKISPDYREDHRPRPQR